MAHLLSEARPPRGGDSWQRPGVGTHVFGAAAERRGGELHDVVLGIPLVVEEEATVTGLNDVALARRQA